MPPADSSILFVDISAVVEQAIEEAVKTTLLEAEDARLRKELLRGIIAGRPAAEILLQQRRTAVIR